MVKEWVLPRLDTQTVNGQITLLKDSFIKLKTIDDLDQVRFSMGYIFN